MQKNTVLVLTLEETREALVKHYTNFLVSNPAQLASLMREGRLDDLPNLATANSRQLTKMYRENKVGDTLAAEEKVDTICVNVDCDTLEVVYTKPTPKPAPVMDDKGDWHGGDAWHQSVS